MPTGTTAQRPTGTAGKLRYNSTTGEFEGYTDAWGSIGAPPPTIHTYRYWRMTNINTESSGPYLTKWVFFDDYDGQGNIIAGEGVTSGITFTASHNSSLASSAANTSQYNYWYAGLNSRYTYETAWIRYAFSTAKTVKSMAVSYRNSSSNTMFGGGTFVIQGSTNGSTWVDVVSPNFMSPRSMYGTDMRNAFNLV